MTDVGSLPGGKEAQVIAAIRERHLKANVAEQEEMGRVVRWDLAYVDHGGTIFGPGPYLHVPIEVTMASDGVEGPGHNFTVRVYPPERLRKKLAKLLPGLPAVVGSHQQGDA